MNSVIEGTTNATITAEDFAEFSDEMQAVGMRPRMVIPRYDGGILNIHFDRAEHCQNDIIMLYGDDADGDEVMLRVEPTTVLKIDMTFYDPSAIVWELR